jgi:hypothetical protein
MILAVLALLWALGIAVILRDLERDQSARMKADRRRSGPRTHDTTKTWRKP